jgi:hypothetical protein
MDGGATSDCAKTLGGDPADSVTLTSNGTSKLHSADHAFSIYSIAPSCKALVFLGEVEKFVGVSPGRMKSIACTDSGLVLELRPLDGLFHVTKERVVLAIASLGGGGAVKHVVVELGTEPVRVTCQTSSASRNVPSCTHLGN